jgi:hypothetical protein
VQIFYNIDMLKTLTPSEIAGFYHTAAAL